ncbi:M1 family metallopeptidase [Kitasatospora sp. MBT63]|uniref:M1 family metallopeptidase n=1 Tax=Kitasatospora sp. MBT63 TaxID=1444768 RepID=UPI000B240CC5|nr:M1 family metallopeptidase [Kitasatospora sp. MBT63]
MTRSSAAAVALRIACAMALFTGVPAATASAAFAAPGPDTGSPTAGGAGSGDPYFPLAGNQGYDVAHYDLDLDFTPATHHLTAEATIRATAQRYLRSFDLDYSGPEITGVEVDGRPARFRREGQELVVEPVRPPRPGEGFTVKVAYQGVPQRISDPVLGDYGWLNTDDGAVALNEPDGARTWYPVNDDLNDKATYTFRITTPSGVKALANGEQHGEAQVHGGRSTVTWEMRRPMASYLSMVAIGDFRVTRGEAGGIPSVTAYDPAAGGDDTFLRATTERAVVEQARRFGRYPFDSVGGIIDRIGVGYELETQSRPVYDGEPDELAVVHEIAHQWFGDSVTPRTWRDIWLNEGFATFAEWRWQEDHGGPTARETFDGYYATPATDPFWQLKTGDPGHDNIFDQDAVYTRGAMTLQALRELIGERDFATLLAEWPTRYRYGNADSCDLRALAEQISHRDLGAFFDAWLYTAAKPAPPA